MSLTAFRKANVSDEFRNQFLLDDVDEEEQEETADILKAKDKSADILEAAPEEPPPAYDGSLPRPHASAPVPRPPGAVLVDAALAPAPNRSDSPPGDPSPPPAPASRPAPDG